MRICEYNIKNHKVYNLTGKEVGTCENGIAKFYKIPLLHRIYKILNINYSIVFKYEITMNIEIKE
jgi:hypothetical protein